MTSADYTRLDFAIGSAGLIRAALSQALVEAGALIKAMAPQTVTLEDLFFSFTEGAEGEPGVRSPEPATAVPPAR